MRVEINLFFKTFGISKETKRVACHFSAGIATGYVIKQEYADSDGKVTPQKTPIFGGDLSADFSWLLQLKANWLKQQTSTNPSQN